MIIREDMVELTMDPSTKINWESVQGDLNVLEAELTEWAAKIKTTEDIIEQGHKYGFLILILEKEQYGIVLGNECLKWETPEDPDGYDASIQAKDTAFDQSKSENKHARRLIEYEKFLGVEENLRSLILQAVDEPFVEALKEEYIGYGGQRPHEIIVHLWTKISKVTNRDKFNLKREVFVAWEQPKVLLAYFKQIESMK